MEALADDIENECHGTLQFTDGRWLFRSDAEVTRRIKRLFVSTRSQAGGITVPHNTDTASDVLWILERYPHTVPADQRRMLTKVVNANRQLKHDARRILESPVVQQPANLVLPLREYQAQGVLLAQMMGGLLVGDDAGLGKTVIAIGLMANPEARPALVVCSTHMQQQWCDEIKKFCPTLRTHVLKQNAEYELPAHEVTISTWHKLEAWAERRKWHTAVYDEIQELRGGAGTGKGRAATFLAEHTTYRLGLSATPVYNMAREIWHIMNFLAPGALGTLSEFEAEWPGAGNKGHVTDPQALSQWLRRQQLYIRRRRRDVGRELPPVLKITQTVDHTKGCFDSTKNRTLQLARAVVEGAFTQRGMAARELDIMLRQITGIGKAPFVAEFVKELVEGGEKVVLAVWHREVIDIIKVRLRDAGIHAVMYTGSETPNVKIEAVKQFTKGEAKVFIMSLRSGAGLNELQTVCRTVVFGELDWSPGVMNQLLWRVDRDGQKDNVTAFYLVSEDGSDPVIAGVLGLKQAQADGITDPDLQSDTAPAADVPETRVATLARDWIRRLTA